MENQQASRPPSKNLNRNVPVQNACNAWMHSIIHNEIAKQEERLWLQICWKAMCMNPASLTLMAVLNL